MDLLRLRLIIKTRNTRIYYIEPPTAREFTGALRCSSMH